MSLDAPRTVTTRAGATIARQLAAVRAAVPPPLTPEETSGLVFARGAEVVHLPTGQKGIVLRGRREAALVAAARPFDVRSV